MPLSSFQRDLCRLLSASRIASGQSYVAGGSALNEVLGAPRLSRDVDVFHDTLEALDATWQADRELLKAAHYGIDILRERSGFVEAEVHQGGERVLVQWLRDSAFRFFPLQAHPDLGLTLHPFDAATNKMLALAGREEPRDWIDALTCHHKVAPLGLLAWAACGKDEGWNPQLILEEAARNARMSRAELGEIEWDGPAPDFAVLKGQWRQAWREAHLTLEILPPAQAGKAVLQNNGEVFRGNNAELSTALHQQLRFHDGHIGGAWPQIKIL
jgi:hypothetical protein